MFWPGKFVGVVVFAIAISLCLTVCSMPEMFEQKATAGHCNTDHQEEEQNDSQMRCCNRESILPPTYTYMPPEASHAMLAEEGFEGRLPGPISSIGFGQERFLVDSSPPPIAAILRI